MDKATDRVTREIIRMMSTMEEDKKERFIAAVKEVLLLPELDRYLESNASATLRI